MHDDRPLEPDAVPETGPTDPPGEAGLPAPPPEPAVPVTGRERILTLDLLRGFALLGILLVNVWAYGMPFPAAMNPNLAGYGSAADKIVFAVVFLTVYSKTMPIFSMLFGAGVLLLATRMEERRRKPGRFVLRRQGWLLVFGLIHAYLMWNGDILVPYAFAGAIVFLFRKRRPRTLLTLAIICLLVPKLLAHGAGYFLQRVEITAAEARRADAAGETLTADQARALDIVEQNGPSWNPTPEKIEELKAVYRGPAGERIAHDAPETLVMHLFLYPVFIGWNITGYMLLGMMLFKTGVLTGARTGGFYRWMAALGYGLGVPLTLGVIGFYDRHPDSFAPVLRWAMPLAETSGALVALGHVALVMLAHRGGWLPALQVRLRAVGRMAFTNYIAHTVICTTIFFGHGFAQWGAWSRPQLMILALAVWALQLWWSPWWLARFRFGPLEWLWRSLTYRKRPPFRVGG
jgi:uncharacterized protein